MTKAILFDFSRVLLFPIDDGYFGSLNELHKQNLSDPNYSIVGHFKLNTDLLDYLKTVQVPLYILTSETIQDAPEFQEYLTPFKKIYSAQKLGMNKKEVEVYKFIANDLGLETNEILFIDDSAENVKAAHEIGLKTIQYQSNEQVLKELSHEFDNNLG